MVAGSIVFTNMSHSEGGIRTGVTHAHRLKLGVLLPVMLPGRRRLSSSCTKKLSAEGVSLCVSGLPCFGTLNTKTCAQGKQHQHLSSAIELHTLRHGCSADVLDSLSSLLQVQ